MKSYRIHACSPDTDGKLSYLVLSLCGRDRLSLDLTNFSAGPMMKGFTAALTIDALYQLLEGKTVDISRKGADFRLRPDGDQLIIEQGGVKIVHRVWMAEMALAWNMLAGHGTAIKGTKQ